MLVLSSTNIQFPARAKQGDKAILYDSHLCGHGSLTNVKEKFTLCTRFIRYYRTFIIDLLTSAMERREIAETCNCGEMEMSQSVREQVDKNYEAFVSMLPNIIAQYRNKYALMKDGQIIGYYSTLEDAYMTANKFYPNELYSVQKVTDVPIDLGFFSHAMHIG
jgi:Family of unknown function (DUF5678)